MKKYIIEIFASLSFSIQLLLEKTNINILVKINAIITTILLSIALITRIIKFFGKDIRILTKASNITKPIKLENKITDPYFYDKKIDIVIEAAEEAVFLLKKKRKGAKRMKELWSLVWHNKVTILGIITSGIISVAGAIGLDQFIGQEEAYVLATLVFTILTKAAAGKGFETPDEAIERVRLKKESNEIHLAVKAENNEAKRLRAQQVVRENLFKTTQIEKETQTIANEVKTKEEPSQPEKQKNEFYR